MQRANSQPVFSTHHRIGARSASKGLAYAFVCATGFFAASLAFAGSCVEFDFARAAACRDITPPEQLARYPNQRLIETALPVSVRFHGVAMDDVEELDIEIDGAAAGFRVHDFAPATRMTTDIANEIETTTTTKKSRSIDGTLGGTLPIPYAQAAAHVTPSITADLSGCETETEKINRLPPKHALVVSGTTSEARGVFFKLKRSSQTSLEGVHQLAIIFIAPRTWPGSELRVACTARGQKKMLWMKQAAVLADVDSTVRLVEASPVPVRQFVFKPTAPPASPTAPAVSSSPAGPVASKWSPTRPKAAKETTAKVDVESPDAKNKNVHAAVTLSTDDSDAKTPAPAMD
jgi:hypothetical protein